MLRREAYVVQTARDGFEALAALRGSQPEIVISDLKMPNMSGFELLAIVRTRFPGIGVIVCSGEFSPLAIPEGALADRFVRKGENSAFELVETVRELVTQLPLRAQPAKIEIAPAWLPLSNSGYVVVTCPNCLRSFSEPMRNIKFGVVQHDACLHCGAQVTYRLDRTTSTDAPTVTDKLRSRLESSRRTIDDSKTAIEESKKRIGESRK
jgi:CheY-like chemotaxis protein